MLRRQLVLSARRVHELVRAQHTPIPRTLLRRVEARAPRPAGGRGRAAPARHHQGGRGWCRVEALSNVLARNSKQIILMQSRSDIVTYGAGGISGAKLEELAATFAALAQNVQ